MHVWYGAKLSYFELSCQLIQDIPAGGALRKDNYAHPSQLSFLNDALHLKQRRPTTDLRVYER